MTRNAFWLAVLLPGVIACGNSPSSGTTASDGGDGGTTGAPINGACVGTDYTQGNCRWPQYCLQAHCISPQNVSAQGIDTPANACATQSSSVQGLGNLDSERAEEDAGLEIFAPLSAIIIDLQQSQIQSAQDCVDLIGHNTAEYEESAKGCMGGNPDTAGIPICASREAAIVFKGDAYDPQGRFATKEGTALDAQFYWTTGEMPPINFMDQMYGAAQSGFIIPGTGWTKNGGPLLIIQCLGKAFYPLEINAAPVTLHFADTGPGDAGFPGNSFCTTWSP